MHGGGVHGDEWWDGLVTASRALDNVGRPGGIVEAGAALRALHPTVAPVEVAAHAQAEAVGLVLAQELDGLHGGEGHGECTVAVVVEKAGGVP